ncbi:MAG: AAA family ATPase [Chloroflexus sp.]|nr:AAA family ATPase [Chloroflexus sp.]MCS6888437.1 AAA family ATPase [Chloroflexus sp.]MDW8404520.1 AAA family ATPase [Chloroflexus sp.]
MSSADFQGIPSLIPRPAIIDHIQRLLAIHPVVALLGPRQCGKTTVARMHSAEQPVTYFDLEHPVDARRLTAPLTVLEALSGLVIIDEVQRQPELFALLRVLVDRPHKTAHFTFAGFSLATLDARRCRDTSRTNWVR